MGHLTEFGSRKLHWAGYIVVVDPGFQKSDFGFWKWPLSNGLNAS